MRRCEKPWSWMIVQSLTAASSETAKAEESSTREESETSKDKPARKRKWGSAKSSGNKRTSLEISTDSLKVRAVWTALFLWTYLVPWNEALIPCGCAHAAYFCCLGKHSETETSFKTNFRLMKGENSVTSYCIVLMFKLAKKIWWLVKEILVFWSIDIYFLWMMTEIIKLMTQIMDKCLILNELGRRRMKLCQSVM